MKRKIIEKTAYAAAYSAWFADYERERKRQRKRCGARLDGFPEAPANPEAIAQTIDQLGTRRVLNVLQVHRSTVARWLAGTSVMPRSSWLLLVLLAEGRLPGMSDDWRQFRFDGDRLCQIGTNQSYSAREIAGWPYQLAHARALARQIAQLEKEKAHLLKVGYFEAANDPLICAS